jgi:hypothetical protein
MPSPQPEVLALMAVAAELRASGLSWETVAERVGRNPRTCRRWLAEYPGVWDRLYRRAELRVLESATAEAVIVLRNLLRSEDEKVRRDAARFLLQMRLQFEPGEAPATGAGDSDAERIAAFLQGQGDAGVQELVGELESLNV